MGHRCAVVTPATRASRCTKLGGVSASRCRVSFKDFFVSKALAHVVLEGFLGGGPRKKRSYLHGACVCMWTWWQTAPLRLEHVWDGSGTGLERGLERLREWLALWNAFNRERYRTVTVSYRKRRNCIAPSRTKVPEHRYSFLHFFLLLSCSFAPSFLLHAISALAIALAHPTKNDHLNQYSRNKVWNGGLERRSGSHVGSGPCSGPYKLTRSHILTLTPGPSKSKNHSM